MHSSPARYHHASQGVAHATAIDAIEAIEIDAIEDDDDAELYHVVFAPDDIREVTLEQLDDCFRLGLIDEKTWVWTEGMPRWQTLSEAAELETPEPVPASGSQRRLPPPRPVPPPSRASTTPWESPSPQPRQGAGAVRAMPLQSMPVQSMPVQSMPVQSMPVRTMPVQTMPVQTMPVHASVRPPLAYPPPAVRPSGAASPTPQRVPVRAVQQPQSAFAGVPVQPMSHPLAQASLMPTAREPFDSTVFGNRSGRLRSRFQATLWWACLLAGAAITLYRTDVLLLGAQHFGQESAYLQLEQRWLGGAPGGTPREVRALVGQAAQVEAPGAPSVAATHTPDTSSAALEAANGVVPPVQVNAAREVGEAPGKTPTPVESPTPRPEAAGSTTLAASTRSKSSADAASARAANHQRVVPSQRPAPRPVAAKRADRKPRASSSSQESNDSSKSKTVAAAAEQPGPAPGTDDFLRMSMREAVRKSEQKKPTPAKKKRSGSAYDPLNGEL